MLKSVSGVLTGQSYPSVIISGLVALAVFVPYVARVILPDSSIHPASFAALGLAIVVFIVRRHEAAAEFKRHWPVYAAGATVASIALGITLLNRGDYGKSYVVNHMVVPLVIFALVQVLLSGRRDQIQAVGRAVVAMGCLQAALGVLQSITQSTVVFGDRYGNYSWLDAMIAEGRVMGTLDHPLVLALFLLICIPLSFSARLSLPFLALANVVLLVGIFLTQSRLGVVAAVIMLLSLLVYLAGSRRQRAAILGGLGVVLAAAFVSPIGQALLGRFQNDQGSNNRRLAALDLYRSVWAEHIFSGSGLGSSYFLTGDAALKSSFENPVLMMAVDIGLVWAAIWIIIQVALALRIHTLPSVLTRLRHPDADAATVERRRSETVGLQIAAVAAVVFTQSFSSTATESASSVLVWFALALLTAARAAPFRLTQRDAAAGGQQTLVVSPDRKA